jgi:GNAT superfamily N-acetyltransferase
MTTTVPLRNVERKSIDYDLPPARVIRTDFTEAIFSGHPEVGQPGIAVSTKLEPMRHPDSAAAAFVWRNDVLYRGEDGRLIGVLRHYPMGVRIARDLLKAPGEYSVAVLANYRRRGIGFALLEEADAKWGLDFRCQEFSPEGRALAVTYLWTKERGGPPCS